MPNPFLNPVMRRLGRLSYPRLFMLAAALFGLDVIVPDFIPFADEILLGMATLLLANWKRRKTDPSATADPIEGQARRR